MSDQKYAKPLPTPSPETQFFWDKCRAHELWVPYCRACQRFYWFPRDFCPVCGSRDVEWRQASGRGTIYTYAIHYRAFHPGWNDDVPYVTALIDLEEGVRIFTQLVGIAPDPKVIRCEMPVEVLWDDVTPEVTLPKWKPV